MKVYTSKHELIILANEALSAGGEGEVYNVVSSPDRFKNICVKIYYQKKRTPLQERKIKYMVTNPPSRVDGGGFMIGWPLDYVMDADGKFLGFVMPLAFSGSKQLITLTSTKLSKKLETAWHQRYDRSNGKSALISRMKLICNIAIPIHILHSTGLYVLKDFKPENILITYDGRVTIVDMDSVQISEGTRLLFAGTAATPNYMPPEYYNQGVGKNPTAPLEKSWDYFAIGVVFYQILFGLHPFVVTPKEPVDEDSNEIYQSISQNLFPFGVNNHKIKSYPALHDKFKVLPQPFQNLFLRAFSDNPQTRPGADEWGKYVHPLVKNIGPISYPPPPPPKSFSQHDSDNHTNSSKKTNQQNPPKNYLIAAIIVTVLCGLLGVVAIVYASKVNPAWEKGNFQEAQEASGKAKLWTYITVVVGLICNVLFLLLSQ